MIHLNLIDIKMRNLLKYPITKQEVLAIIDRAEYNETHLNGEILIGGNQGFVLGALRQYIDDNWLTLETIFKV